MIPNVDLIFGDTNGKTFYRKIMNIYQKNSHERDMYTSQNGQHLQMSGCVCCIYTGV
jgi:hypothetical protein